MSAPGMKDVIVTAPLALSSMVLDTMAYMGDSPPPGVAAVAKAKTSEDAINGEIA